MKMVINRLEASDMFDQVPGDQMAGRRCKDWDDPAEQKSRRIPHSIFILPRGTQFVDVETGLSLD